MDFQYSIFFIATTLDLWLRAKADFFTAIAHLEPLLNTQKKIINNLEDYIANGEKRLVVLKKHLNRYKMERNLAMEDISNYLENPINAFTIIKRLTIDLDYLQNSIAVSSDYVKSIMTNNPDMTYPAFEDIIGAIQGLTRLQEIYRLEAEDLAEGRLVERNSRGSKDPVITTPMTASDCFEIGLALYVEEKYDNSLLWMMESLRKVKNGDDLFNITETEILEYISFTHYNLGDIRTAIEWSKKLLTLNPEHPKASVNLKVFQEMLDQNKLEDTEAEVMDEDKDDNDDNGGKQSKNSTLSEEEISTVEPLEEKVLEDYEALCRGDIDIPMEIQRRLKCSYLTKNHPFLKLAPIKMEQIYIRPDVFFFHEIISDEEIEHIKDLVNARITRAEVIDSETGYGVTVPYRISKVAWLNDDQSEVVERVMQRASDFTGLSMATAEELQVANYGIGGHYEPHYDFDHEHVSFMSAKGERIATVLFYMSDVPQGGATVFTELGLTVYPIKNSALFWHNLLPSGEGNLATRHAACPVLRGSKWASTKWIYNIGQELIKPCIKEL